MLAALSADGGVPCCAASQSAGTEGGLTLAGLQLGNAGLKAASLEGCGWIGKLLLLSALSCCAAAIPAEAAPCCGALPAEGMLGRAAEALLFVPLLGGPRSAVACRYITPSGQVSLQLLTRLQGGATVHLVGKSAWHVRSTQWSDLEC